jgi:hypothetical protein
MHAATSTDLRRADRGAGTPPRSDPQPGRTGPGRDGVLGRRWLGCAGDRRPAALQPRDGAPAAQSLPPDGGGRPAPPAAGATARHRPAGPGRGGARCLARPGSHLDRGATRGDPRRRVRHRLESAPDAQIPEPHRRLAAHRAHAPAQAGSGESRARHGRAQFAQKKAAAGRIRLVYLDECGFAPVSR